MGNIRIGISGWRYEPWRGVFYPKELAQRRELEFASRAFPTIEINGSFYSLQHPASYQSWYDETPPDFVFAIKGGRYITQMVTVDAAVAAESREAFVPESLDTLPYALPRQDTRWNFGPRVSAPEKRARQQPHA